MRLCVEPSPSYLSAAFGDTITHNEINAALTDIKGHWGSKNRLGRPTRDTQELFSGQNRFTEVGEGNG